MTWDKEKGGPLRCLQRGTTVKTVQSQGFVPGPLAIFWLLVIYCSCFLTVPQLTCMKNGADNGQLTAAIFEILALLQQMSCLSLQKRPCEHHQRWSSLFLARTINHQLISALGYSGNRGSGQQGVLWQIPPQASATEYCSTGRGRGGLGLALPLPPASLHEENHVLQEESK